MTRLRRDDDGRWRARLGQTRMTWLGAADAERVPDGHGGKPLVAVIELARARATT